MMDPPSNPSSFDIAIDNDGGQYPDIIEIDANPMKTAMKKYLLPVVFGMVLVVLLCAALVFWGEGEGGGKGKGFDNTVLIVSLDGFRDRFLDEKDPSLFPNMALMREEGFFFFFFFFFF